MALVERSFSFSASLNEKINVIKLPEGKRNDFIIQCKLLFIFKNCCYFEDTITLKSAAYVFDFF